MLAAAQIAELNPAEIMRHVQQLQQYAAQTALRDKTALVRAQLAPLIAAQFRKRKYLCAEAFESDLTNNTYAQQIIKRLHLPGGAAAGSQYYANWKDLMQKLHTTLRTALLASIKKLVKNALTGMPDDERAIIGGLGVEELMLELGREGKLFYIIQMLATSAKNGPRLGPRAHMADALANDEAFLRAAAAYAILGREWSSKAGSKSAPLEDFLDYFATVYAHVNIERTSAAALAAECAAAFTRRRHICDDDGSDEDGYDDDDAEHRPPTRSPPQRAPPRSPDDDASQAAGPQPLRRDDDDDDDGAAEPSTARRSSEPPSESADASPPSDPPAARRQSRRTGPPPAQKRRRGGAAGGSQ